MQHLKIVLAAVGLLTIVGCKPINGTLRLKESLTLKTDQLNCREDDMRPECIGPREDAIAAGEYSATVMFQSKREVSIKVNTSRWAPKTIALKIPEGKILPNYSGPIQLSSRESGQPFNLSGNIQTHESRSDVQHGVESCTFTRHRRICDSRGCREETVTYTGQQSVSFYYHYTTILLDLNIIKLTNNSVIGRFDGRRDETQKVYTYQGPCF